MKKEFFNVISVKDFFSLFSKFDHIKETETITLFDAYQRVLAEDIVSKEDLPPFDRATMDGYAVRAKDTFGASESNPVYLKKIGSVEIGSVPDFEIRPEECAEIVTGGMMPKGADGVVMVEFTEDLGEEVEIRKAIAPGENVILASEDCKKGERVLTKGIRLRAQDLGILAALGIGEVKVYKKIKVGIISTGNELVEVTKKPKMGQIRDVNTYTLYALAQKANAIPISFGIVPDDEETLKDKILSSLNMCDVVLISGGSSVGTRDLTISVLKDLGGEILAHGISISPGKPTILAKVNDKPVIGLPGQVASAQIVMFVLILPFLKFLSGEKNALHQLIPYLKAKMARNVASKQGREDYIRVKLKKEGSDWIAEPILAKSGLLKSLLEADGLVKIPYEKEGLEKNEEVKVIFF